MRNYCAAPTMWELPGMAFQDDASGLQLDGHEDLMFTPDLLLPSQPTSEASELDIVGIFGLQEGLR